MRTDTATLFIPVDATRLYDAFVDRESLMAWLPPEGMRGRALLFEPHEGGHYRIELTYEEALPSGGTGKTSTNSDITAGRFVRLEPGRRVVMSVEFESDDPSFEGEMLMTWSFDVAPGGTRVTVTAENVPAGISAEDHAAGLSSSLANLSRFAQR